MISPVHLSDYPYGDYTACGMASDACESGDEDEMVLFAKPGEVATCPKCQGVVDYFKSIKRYREPKP